MSTLLLALHTGLRSKVDRRLLIEVETHTSWFDFRFFAVGQNERKFLVALDSQHFSVCVGSTLQQEN